MAMHGWHFFSSWKLRRGSYREAPPFRVTHLPPGACLRVNSRFMLNHEGYLNRRFFGSLDGVRAAAVTGVVWHHSARHADLPLADAGAMGVDLFFAVSGFLITTLLLRERDRTATIALAAFYARRALRIFPLYYAVLLLYVGIVWVVEPNDVDRSRFFENLPFFATYTSNWFVTLDGGRVIFYFAWSLATEEQFYAVWPSIERYLGARRPWVSPALALAVVAIWIAVHGDLLPLAADLQRKLVVNLAPPICLGVVLAHALHRPRAFAGLWRLLGHRLSSPLLALFALASVTGGPLLLSHVLLVLFVGACAIREDHGLARILTVRPLLRIGAVSYGIYLFHMLVLQAAERTVRALDLRIAGLPSAVVTFAIAMPLTWALATLSFEHFERFFLRRKERFRPGAAPASAPPPPVAALGA